MFRFLYPKEYLNSVFELDVAKMKQKGIDTILFDIDNTLVPYWIKVPTKELSALFESLRAEGFKLGVLSNSKEERSKVFCAEDNITYVFRAKKPLNTGFNSIIKKLNSKPEKTLLVGDQIFTDVWCANRAGAYSVLVKQVSPKDEWITWTKRGIEKIVLKAYLKSEARKNG